MEGLPSAGALAEGFRQHSQPGRLPPGIGLRLTHRCSPRGIAVARYYFDILNDAQSVHDEGSAALKP